MKIRKNYILFLIIPLCVLFMLFSKAGSVNALQNTLSIEDVHVDRDVLNPGEEAAISFRMTGNASVTVHIYNSDYEVVRLLIDKETRPAGIVVVNWDGIDDAGIPVPAEAYMVSIIAEGSDGQKAVYDPTAVSGGEILDIQAKEEKDELGHYTISYTLPASARVNIMAGIHNGPMLKTVLDWKPQPPGHHVRIWDGYDETARIDLTGKKDRTIYVTGFLLPENTIIVKGKGRVFRNTGKQTMTPESSNVISQGSVRKNIIKRYGKRISKQYMIPARLNTAPKFKVYLRGDNTFGLAERDGSDVSGILDLSIEVDPESIESFNESRYEIVVYADNDRIDEEEQAYTPYNYSIDTAKLGNGEHWITINLLSLTGQAGSYSFKINVRN